MGRGAGEEIPFLTEEEMQTAIVKERGVVACAGVQHGALTVLKLAFRTGDIGTIYLDELAACHVIGVLKALFPRIEAIVASEAKQGSLGIEARSGRLVA